MWQKSGRSTYGVFEEIVLGVYNIGTITGLHALLLEIVLWDGVHLSYEHFTLGNVVEKYWLTIEVSIDIIVAEKGLGFVTRVFMDSLRWRPLAFRHFYL